MPTDMLCSCLVAVQNSERNPGVLLSKLVSFPTAYTFQVGAARPRLTFIKQLRSWLDSKQNMHAAHACGCSSRQPAERLFAAAGADPLRVLRWIPLFLTIMQQQSKHIRVGCP